MSKTAIILSELTNHFTQSPIYSYGAKGYGGSLGPERMGLDCSGLVTGILSRFGLCSHKDRDSMSSEMLRKKSKAVSSDSLEFGDLAFYGGKKAYHVGIYVGQGFIIEAGGAARDATPPSRVSWYSGATSSDFPPKRGRIRLSPYNYRRDFMGFGRYRSDVSEEDHFLIHEWNKHVETGYWSDALEDALYRPVTNKYYDSFANNRHLHFLRGK
jgi:cell wall-associated NlpC family hydrolase